MNCLFNWNSAYMQSLIMQLLISHLCRLFKIACKYFEPFCNKNSFKCVLPTFLCNHDNVRDVYQTWCRHIYRHIHRCSPALISLLALKTHTVFFFIRWEALYFHCSTYHVQDCYQMKPKCPRGTRFWRKKKSLWVVDEWFIGWRDSESAYVPCQRLEGRTEQGALDSLQSLESICKDLRS